jgi:hypothetical protein
MGIIIAIEKSDSSTRLNYYISPSLNSSRFFDSMEFHKHFGEFKFMFFLNREGLSRNTTNHKFYTRTLQITRLIDSYIYFLYTHI